MNNALQLVRAARARNRAPGETPFTVPTEVIGAYGERVAARLLGARVVSGPGVDDHDLLLDGRRIEVKTGFKEARCIGDLRGKVRDRVVFVELEVIDGRLCARACSFYASSTSRLGRRPSRATFRAIADPVPLTRPIRLRWSFA